MVAECRWAAWAQAQAHDGSSSYWCVAAPGSSSWCRCSSQWRKWQQGPAAVRARALAEPQQLVLACSCSRSMVAARVWRRLLCGALCDLLCVAYTPPLPTCVLTYCPLPLPCAVELPAPPPPRSMIEGSTRISSGMQVKQLAAKGTKGAGGWDLSRLTGQQGGAGLRVLLCCAVCCWVKV